MAPQAAVCVWSTTYCTEYKNVLGATVTRFCGKYGLVDDSIYFTSNDVLGGMPLQVGQKVNVVAQKNETSGGWKAVKVEPVTNQWEGDDDTCSSPAENETHNLMGNVTSCNKDGGYINETIYFSMADACEGFQPYKGDWVQAQYSIEPTTWKSQAYCLKPLRYKRVDKVPITQILHRGGVVNDIIFFTLDSLRMPQLYVPKKDDLVNVVIIESNQSLYQWRALCIGPANKESSSVPAITSKDLDPIDLEFFHKEGLEVTRKIDFGTIRQGEKKDLMVWIENKGKKAQSLLKYKLAGWERDNQFLMTSPQLLTASENGSKQQTHTKFASNCRMTQSQSSCTALGSFLPCVSDQQDSKLPSVTFDQKNVSSPPERLSSKQDGSLNSRSTPDDKFLNNLPSASASCITQLSCLQTLDDAHVKCEKVTHELSPTEEIGESLLQILPGGKAYIKLMCEAKNPGRNKDFLLLYFNNFTMGCYVEVDVTSDEEYLLVPRSSYHPIQSKSFQSDQKETNFTVVSVRNPSRLARRRIPSFLPQYAVPERLKECIERDADILTIQPNLSEALSMSKYKDHFSTLLWLEEIKAKMEMREFNMPNVTLRKKGDFLILEVPGLVEGRPSVSVGDRIILKNSCYTESEVRYSGFVLEVYEDELVLKFNSSFQQAYGGEPMDVEFTYNRTSTRRCLFAVEQAIHLGEQVLFPENVAVKPPQTVTTWDDIYTVVTNEKNNCCRLEGQTNKEKDVAAKLNSSCTGGNYTGKQSNGQECTFFNSLLNDYQKSAVKRILRGECRPIPYIVFGPPGTGKTVTILEAILQIHFTLPDSRILACAPSNSAADLLCLRLHESNLLKQGDMVRVNATCRPAEYIPEIIQLYSKDGEDLWDAARCRIIISTCSTAGLFYQIGLRIGHFTHVFVDEAGQASEPECLIPMLLVSEEDGQIVLAGDPMQLGPIIKSRIASAYGLCVSLLERLMARPSYCRDENFAAFGSYSPLLVTKLVNNYRSHSSLLALPSKLFYHQELKMSSDQSVVNKFCNWEKLPRKGFPIIFHGLRGNEMREGSNPSWFNPKEAVQVMRYCCLLAKHCTNPVKPSEIGVIAPYQKQVQKIRILLRSGYLSDLKVGSVEEFQGQEKLVIIVSTVRSSEENLAEDTRYVLGFLSNPKRFNVAITRAKALLIVVGNPHILLKDPCWGAFLEYCVTNNAYVGCDLPHEVLIQQRAISGKK
ncbi:RNA helicase Mov10l1 [Hemiscyllium ocellatum]|uniref:RNA helicase Mov10l1 n=1 Tax=Hemiscyllium ocellatum TaxID=170820 RepID=UPI0029667D1E|nr:RNA helicase Mov10l1 [Hemiscyllium ocellatum]